MSQAFRVSTPEIFAATIAASDREQAERDAFHATTERWLASTNARLALVSEVVEADPTNAEAQMTLKILQHASLGHRICRISSELAHDCFGMQWELEPSVSECIALVELTRRLYDEMCEAMGGQVPSFICDGMLIGVMQICRECRDPRLRRLAMGVCRDLMGPDTSRDVRAVVLGFKAVVRAEELGRGADGRIPPEERWEWNSGSWNRDFQELCVGLSKKVFREDGMMESKTLLVGVDDV